MEDDIQTKILLFLNDKAAQYVCDCKKRTMRVSRIYYDRIYWTRAELTCSECGELLEVKIAYPKEIVDEYLDLQTAPFVMMFFHYHNLL